MSLIKMGSLFDRSGGFHLAGALRGKGACLICDDPNGYKCQLRKLMDKLLDDPVTGEQAR